VIVSLIVLLNGLLIGALLAHYLFDRRSETQLRIRENAPPPEAEGSWAKLSPEQREADVHDFIVQARNQDRMLRDSWAAEKREEGWSDEDMETFLANRPEIELN
jgi:uncharacterized membrane protein